VLEAHRLLADRLADAALALRGPERALGHHRRERLDAGQRRAQLVRDDRQVLVLQLVGLELGGDVAEHRQHAGRLPAAVEDDRAVRA
jgi:hypothetical protein